MKIRIGNYVEDKRGVVYRIIRNPHYRRNVKLQMIANKTGLFIIHTPLRKNSIMKLKGE